jgi:hypothetical protein
MTEENKEITSEAETESIKPATLDQCRIKQCELCAGNENASDGGSSSPMILHVADKATSSPQNYRRSSTVLEQFEKKQGPDITWLMEAYVVEHKVLDTYFDEYGEHQEVISNICDTCGDFQTLEEGCQCYMHRPWPTNPFTELSNLYLDCNSCHSRHEPDCRPRHNSYCRCRRPVECRCWRVRQLTECKKCRRKLPFVKDCRPYLRMKNHQESSKRAAGRLCGQC